MAKIITAPNPILKKISKPVKNIDKKTQDIIKDIKDTLVNGETPKGVGLSGVQIGKLVRVFATYIPKSGNPDDNASPQLKIFVNPEILRESKEKTLGPNPDKPILEGCLSIPGIWGSVWRKKWVKLKYQMENGKWTTKKITGFPARVIQHELDHLNGILFTQHSLEDDLPLYKSQGDELVQISIK